MQTIVKEMFVAMVEFALQLIRTLHRILAAIVCQVLASLAQNVTVSAIVLSLISYRT
jgi:hypothetical protein